MVPVTHSRKKSKRCTRCGKRKPISAFYRNARYADGFVNHCSTCKSAVHKTYDKKRRHRSWTYRLFYYAQTGHSGKNWEPCDLDEAYLCGLYEKQNGRCYWTQVRLTLGFGKTLFAVSLDRLDSTRGYVRGNVVLACRAANLAKNDHKPREMQAFVRAVRAAAL